MSNDDSTASDQSVPGGVAAAADVYDQFTVGDVRDAVRDADVAATDLEALYRYEASHKHRTTVLDWLADRIIDAGGTVPDAGDDADADGEPDADAESDPAPTESPVTRSAPESESETQVTLRAPSTGYYGGEWFDSGGTKNVTWSPRLADAVRDGPLTVVAARNEDALPEDLRPSRDRRGA